MSVFFKNICQFNNCKKNFYTLRDLIIHIENDHLDFDPCRIEQLEEERPESLPLSYVLKFSNSEDVNQAVIQELDDIPIMNEVVTSLNNNYLGCDIKDKKTSLNFTKSNDLRLKKDEISQIIGFENHKLFTLDNKHKKPFACNMPGCERRYKNINGIKYHYKNHHKIHAPSVKKSLLKYKPVFTNANAELDFQEIPYFKSQTAKVNDPVFHYEDGEQSDYFYKVLPTSTEFHVTNQVPLPNASFNYYNVTDLTGDIEDFSGKNPINFFVPTTFDKL